MEASHRTESKIRNFLGLKDPEEEGTTILETVGTYRRMTRHIPGDLYIK